MFALHESFTKCNIFENLCIQYDITFLSLVYYGRLAFYLDESHGEYMAGMTELQGLIASLWYMYLILTLDLPESMLD